MNPMNPIHPMNPINPINPINPRNPRNFNFKVEAAASLSRGGTPTTDVRAALCGLSGREGGPLSPPKGLRAWGLGFRV